MAEIVRAADPDVSVPVAVLEATRALLRVTTASEARLLGEELVRRLGGELATPETESRSVIPADLSFGDGAPVLAAAQAGSAARSLIERYLTAYLLDASYALELNLRGERLAEFASIDSLTGLLNRRMLDRALGRLAGKDTVILLDLDHFKHVNDEFGHAAGDDVLRAFGRALRSAGRGSEVIGRFGGDEFVGVLDAPGNGPDVFLERFRRDWLAARPLPVTFSAGVARSVGDPDETIGLADEALYRAKKAGRDQWCWSTSAKPLTTAAPTEYVQPYLKYAVAGRRRPAVRLVSNLLDNRVTLGLIVEDLLAVAQHVVGDRWQRNELTAADEHLATGVAAAVMDALSGDPDAPRSRSDRHHVRRGRLALTGRANVRRVAAVTRSGGHRPRGVHPDRRRCRVPRPLRRRLAGDLVQYAHILPRCAAPG
jgi:diguanylate cyclase (GGDEF)-like protein